MTRFTHLILSLALVAATTPAATGQENEAQSKWVEDCDLIANSIRSKHPMPFRRTTEAAFEAAMARFKSGAGKMSDEEAMVELMRIVASLRDGHTSLLPAKDILWFPVRFYELQDSVFVTAIDRAHGEFAGTKLLRIGNKSGAAAAALAKGAFSSDNEFGAKAAVALFSSPRVLRGLGIIDDLSTLPLEIELPDGSKKALRLKGFEGKPGWDWIFWGEMFGPGGADLVTAFESRGPSGFMDPSKNPKLPLHLRGRRAYWFTYLEDRQALYTQINTMANRSAASNETFGEFVKKLFEFADSHPVRKFVIDLRYNSGGNGGLVNTFVHEIIRRDALNQTGKLFTISGGKTFSAGADLLITLRRHTNSAFVGEPPGVASNAAGDADSLTLPNSKMQLTVSTNYGVSGKFKDQSWNIPVEFPALMNSADYFGGVDPALEVALSREGERTIAGVLRSEGAAAAKRLYEERKRQFGNRPWWQPFTQHQMNSLGYSLLEEKRTDDALAAFSINADRYSQTWETWDSLAEGLMAANRYPEAIAAYEKALRLEPANWNAAAQKAAIEKMRKSQQSP